MSLWLGLVQEQIKRCSSLAGLSYLINKQGYMYFLQRREVFSIYHMMSVIFKWTEHSAVSSQSCLQVIASPVVVCRGKTGLDHETFLNQLAPRQSLSSPLLVLSGRKGKGREEVLILIFIVIFRRVC